MKYRTITGALALAFTLVSASSFARADKPAEAAPKTDAPTAPAEEKTKNLTRPETAQLRAAREKAAADPDVKAAEEKEKAAHKALLAARKGGDIEAIKTAAKADAEAKEAFAKTRRAVIAKTDPDAAKLDERAYAVGERLRKAREAKPAKEKAPEEN